MKIWYCRCKDGWDNAGDMFTPWLLDKMGLKWEYSIYPQFVGAGSILNLMPCENAKIWGAGFHNEDDEIIQKDISKYYAVRGKLSLGKLHTDKKICLGDPGILVSRFYDNSNVRKEYKFGIVPHYVDYDFFKPFKTEECNVIKIDNPNIEQVFEEISKCQFILSSSLHGIIFSHSFGIPAFHIEHNQLNSRGNFKFLDYFSSFGMKYRKLTIEDENDFNKATIEQLFKEASQNPSDFMPPKTVVEKMQEDLLACFPYRGRRILRNLLFTTNQQLRRFRRKLKRWRQA